MDSGNQTTIEINAEIGNGDDLEFLAFETLGGAITNLVGTPSRGTLPEDVRITGELRITVEQENS